MILSKIIKKNKNIFVCVRKKDQALPKISLSMSDWKAIRINIRQLSQSYGIPEK